jgi:hypothetical protein
MLPEFIFTPGLWLGEGKITFSASSEFIKFYTRWQITQQTDYLRAVQTVEMHGIEEQVTNTFIVQDIQPHSFKIILENEFVGRISGTGLRQENTVAWEFRGGKNFEGFEVYERQENGDFFLHAEYGSPDQFRTIIEGLVWFKGEV